MNRLYPGLFVVLEGGDGTGKTTLCWKLEHYLSSRGYGVTVVRDPGTTEISEEIRGIVLNPKHLKMTSMTEFFLYTAARSSLVRERIEPALKDGNVVLCDRFDISTYCYQIYAGGLRDEISKKEFRRIQNLATNSLRPDLILILDSSAYLTEEGEDRMEQKSKEYHGRVRDGYRSYANEFSDNCVILITNDAHHSLLRSKIEIDNLIRDRCY